MHSYFCEKEQKQDLSANRLPKVPEISRRGYMTKQQARSATYGYLCGRFDHWDQQGGLTHNGARVMKAYIAKFVKSLSWKAAPGDTDCADYSAARSVFPFCGMFNGKPDKAGYRRFYFGGTFIGAHRFLTLLEEGRLPPHMHVCHQCDRPGCVIHVVLGTPAENTSAQIERGRKNCASRLTDKQRRLVIRLYDDFSPAAIQGLLKREGVQISTRQIIRIGTGKSWPDEWQALIDSMTAVEVQFSKAMGTWKSTDQENGMEIQQKRILQIRPLKLGVKAPNAKLTREEVTSLRADFLSCNFSLVQLAKRYSIYRQTVSDIVLGKTYGDVEGIVSSEQYSAVMKQARERREYNRIMSMSLPDDAD